MQNGLFSSHDDKENFKVQSAVGAHYMIYSKKVYIEVIFLNLVIIIGYDMCNKLNEKKMYKGSISRLYLTLDNYYILRNNASTHQ